MNYQSNNEEWFAQRLGRFTASRFSDLMASGGTEYSFDGFNFTDKLPQFDANDERKVEEIVMTLVPEREHKLIRIFTEKNKEWVSHEEWGDDKYNLRVATGFGDFVKRAYTDFGFTRKAIGETAKSYILEVAYEQVTGVPLGFGGNAATEWGNTYEDEARTEYENFKGRKVEQVGFCSHPTNRYVGGSPDGLVDSDGAIEIKCPHNGLNHVKNVLEDAFVKDYEWQCQGNLWVTGRKWMDLISYDPRMKGLGKHLHIVRIERDEDKIAQLEARVDVCIELLKYYLKQIGGEEESPF